MNSEELSLKIAQFLNNKKARDVTVIDISDKSSFADYFVIATAGSMRQLGALSDDVADEIEKLGEDIKSKEGSPATGWILIDARDVIVNLFSQDLREKYSLERIWADCEKILVD